MRRFKVIVAVLAVMAMLVVASAAPAMAKGNGVNEERGESPRQQANEENHFNNFDGFNGFSSCVGLCNGGFENDGFFPSFTPFFGTDFFENEGPCDQLLLIQTSQTLCV